KSLHAHMFRHSMASIWLQNGADIRSVMEVLGHKNLETTQRYLHVSKDHTKNMFKKNYNLD
ncbi:MAG: tyrosine-type recombinase/integrase, partial [Tenericutes bacterium]|nr:tyrosine-type recombinase/integrase [Mycoplasmatota bacterium]